MHSDGQEVLEERKREKCIWLVELEQAGQPQVMVKDEALQAQLTGWSPGQLGKLSANAMPRGKCWKKREREMHLIGGIGTCRATTGGG